MLLGALSKGVRRLHTFVGGGDRTRALVRPSLGQRREASVVVGIRVVALA